jgi:valyl-tRNA synthetase
LDPKGKKMSKSKGNIISPQDMKEKYSADALRFAAAATKLGEDVPFPEKELVNGTKVTNKLYQANKFASMLLKDFKAEDREFDFSSLPFIDQWIVSRAQEVIRAARDGYEEYDFWRGKTEFEYFFMHDVADNYIEIVKNRLWNPEEHGDANKKAQQTLYYVLHTVLRGMAPIIPFVTEEIYQNFYREFEGVESIHLSSYPEPVDAWDDAEIRNTGERFLEVVGEARRYKTERSWSMKAGLEEIRIEAPKEQQEIISSSLSDLKAVTGARKIRYEDAESFSVSIISE